MNYKIKTNKAGSPSVFERKLVIKINNNENVYLYPKNTVNFESIELNQNDSVSLDLIDTDEEGNELVKKNYSFIITKIKKEMKNPEVILVI
jgi:hypothetical protein